MGSKKKWKKYFNDDLKARLGKRAKGFEYIFNFLKEETVEPVIIETGTYRIADNYEGDGCSTLLFDKYVECFGGEFHSIDIDPNACKMASENTTYTNVRQGDSIKILGEIATFYYQLNKEVDLLYLDSFNIPNDEFKNDTISAVHHLKELFVARHIINSDTLVVVDDNIILDGHLRGKGRLIYEMMKAVGNEPVYTGYQLMWEGL
tara:strand:- start:9439 stop:10053 length:615 start_codon:yes stop_codon:yes gene_type:complete